MWGLCLCGWVCVLTIVGVGGDELTNDENDEADLEFWVDGLGWCVWVGMRVCLCVTGRRRGDEPEGHLGGRLSCPVRHQRDDMHADQTAVAPSLGQLKR